MGERFIGSVSGFSDSSFLRGLSLALFCLNLNCIQIDQSVPRENLPPGVAKRACPPNPVVTGLGTSVRTPTRRLAEAELPIFSDDLDFAGMDLVLERQLKRFSERDLRGDIWFGEEKYPLTEVPNSLRRLATLIRHLRQCQVGGASSEKCKDEFNQAVRERFAVYGPNLISGDPRFGQAQPVLFTGYYTPRLEVTQRPQGPHQLPIYAKPADEYVSRAGRYMIDFRDQLEGMGLELFYSQSRFDLYLLQVEGGGRVVYRDLAGRTKEGYVSYAGSNGRQWRFISDLMVEKNWIGEPTIAEQRDFVAKNPQLEAEVFSYCPGYVFFKPTSHPPLGSDSVPLTDNRSIATDSGLYSFKGVLAFVKAQRPRDKKGSQTMPFSRFVLDQDTGGAIRGKARVDFYFGEGDYAENAANTLKARGDLFYLMLKREWASKEE